jgi:hypothetical protein
VSEPQFPSYPTDPTTDPTTDRSGEPTPPPTPLPVARPPRPASTGHLVGRVDGAATRVESYGHERSSQTVLSFRLLDAGERPVEVELRGLSLAGTVRDGDWVEVADQRRGGRIEAAALTNLTTGSEVKAVGSERSPGAKVFKVVFVAIFLAILVTFVVLVIGMVTDPNGMF